MDGSSGPTLRTLDASRLMVLVPGVVALGLALLYSVGALLKTFELLDAGIDVTEALPLVPLEQVLARGIGTAAIAVIVASFMGSSMPGRF
jgi:hypothetical protein